MSINLSFQSNLFHVTSKNLNIMTDTKDFHFLTQNSVLKISILATLGFLMTVVPSSAGPHTASDKSQLSMETFTTVFPSLPPLHWRAWWE